MDSDAAFGSDMVYLLFGAVLFGIVTAIVSSNKGNGGFGGFILGFVLGPFGLLIAIVSKPNTKAMDAQREGDPTLKKCPECAELVKLEARKCKHCGSVLEV